MSNCAGCGGVLGRDCWNEADCVWISQDMARQAAQPPPPEPCQGCSEIAGMTPCLGLCAGATCWEDIEARRVLWEAIPQTYADRRISPERQDGAQRDTPGP